MYEVVSGSSTDEEILLPLYYGENANPLSSISNYFEILTDSDIPGEIRMSIPGNRKGMFEKSNEYYENNVSLEDIYSFDNEEEPEDCE